MGERLICKKCRISVIDWAPGTDTYDENLLENGILVCQNDRCGQTYKGMKEYMEANWEKRSKSK